MNVAQLSYVSEKEIQRCLNCGTELRPLCRQRSSGTPNGSASKSLGAIPMILATNFGCAGSQGGTDDSTVSSMQRSFRPRSPLSLPPAILLKEMQGGVHAHDGA